MRGALQRVASSSRAWALAIVATLPIASAGVAGAAADLIKPSATIGKLHDLTGMRCGVDLSGVLVKAVLARGAAFHRGEDDAGHFKVIHKYLVGLVAVLGAAKLVVVLDGARFPASRIRTRSTRQRSRSAPSSSTIGSLARSPSRCARTLRSD